MKRRLSIFVTHPVQYHVPLWRALSSHPALDVRVFYFSDHSVRTGPGGFDPGFGRTLAWDVDLLSGYAHEFLSRDAELAHPRSVRITDVDALLARAAPDFILIGGYTFAFERQLALAARRHRAKLIVRAEFSERSEAPRPFAKRLARSLYLRWFYRRVDRFCFPGEDGRSHLLRHGVPEARQFFSPYSVDDQLIERQKQLLTRAEARRALSIPNQRFMFLFSGKLIPRKDPFAVLEAIRRMPRSEDVGLIVLGDGVLAPEFTLRARVQLADRLIAPGFVNQSQLGSYFLAADALVMPSRHETWGLVVNEAMQYGLPAIVSDRTGCHRDLVHDGSTGFVYPVGREDVLAQHMQELVDMPERTARMGRTAQAWLGRYSIAASARGVFEALGVEPLQQVSSSTPPAPERDGGLLQ